MQSQPEENPNSLFANILLTNLLAPLITRNYSSFKIALRPKTKNHHFLCGIIFWQILIGTFNQGVTGSNPVRPTKNRKIHS
jgi:hypothetical protein